METKQIIKFASFKEAYEALKTREDLNREDPFYNALLEVLCEASEKEARGERVDASTLLPLAMRRYEAHAKAEGISA